MNARRVVLGAWIAAAGLTVVRRLTDPASPSLPTPAVLIGSGVLFTGLYAAAGFMGPLAGALAVGVDVALVARPYMSGSGVSPLETLAAWLGRLEGAPSAGPPASPVTGPTA